MVFNGVVENSTNRPIKVDECRGFVLVDEMAPFMFINNSDGKAAQMFTIAHELAHIWTGHSAVLIENCERSTATRLNALRDFQAEFLVLKFFLCCWVAGLN